MNINVQTIPHKEQRYETCGDWWFETKDGIHTLHIRVSALNDAYEEFCIAIHEQIEALLCYKRGITEKEVTEFDLAFEIKRDKGSVHPFAEPGDYPFAPYRKEHCFATGVERLLVSEFEINWTEYETHINSL